MQAFFLSASVGQRFCVYFPPAQARPLGVGAVFVPAFAEEMNKSRHIVAQTARRLAEAGVGVLLIDPLGCGDSTGSLEDASWQAWHDDIDLATTWLRSRGHPRLMLWGMRLGAMLAAQYAAEQPQTIERCLFWHPVINGDSFLTQFLRLRTANAMLMARSGEGETVKQLRAELAAGRSLEVAGYALTPSLAKALGPLDLEQIRPRCPVQWVEVVVDAASEPTQAAVRVSSKWRELGTQVDVVTVAANAFWGVSNATELVQCPEIAAATLSLVRAWAP
jgi:exosortase A-associated hydrolase 2